MGNVKGGTTMKKPYLSIIVPVFKVERYINNCIDSILAQTYKNFELILIDDGSPDNCPKICDDYAVKDTRVRVIHQQNSGQVKARKEGLKIAQGEYIGFVDSDDWIEGDMFEIMCKHAITDEADIVICHALFEYERETLKYKEKTPPGLYFKEDLIQNMYPTMLYNGHCGGRNILSAFWNKIYRKKLLKNNFYEVDERFQMGEDTACVYACLLEAKVVRILEDEYLYHYRQSPESITNSYKNNLLENTLVLCDYMAKSFEKKNVIDMGYQIEGYFLSLVMESIDNIFSENSNKTSREKRQYLEHVSENIKINHALNIIPTSKYRIKYKMYVKLLKNKKIGALFYLICLIRITKRI